MRNALLRAGLVLGLATAPASAFAQKALVYCPPQDQTGCNAVVTALTGIGYPGGVDRAYDGSGGTVDIRSADLFAYSVFVVPSLADDATSQPYGFLRDAQVQEHLRAALIGGLAVWSGTPDQGSSNRDAKDQLIRNLAGWAGASFAQAHGPGLVALLDLSETEGARYDWLRSMTPMQLASDVTMTTYDSVRTLTATGAAIRGSLAFQSMAALGLATPTATPGLRIDALGATGGPVGGQVVLATLPAGNTSTARMSTDKLDYQPGEMVTISGSGWAPNEVVTITLHEDPLVEQDSSWVAVADGFGSFTSTHFAPDQMDVGTRFVLTADGGTSGMRAQATFTDAGAKMNKIFSDAGLTNEAYQFAVGQTVYAQASNLTAARGYKFEAKNAAGASQFLGVCKTGATTASDSYTPTTPSGAADWTWVLHEWTSNTCASGPQSEDADNTLAFDVAQATAYTTSALTTTTTTYGAGQTAFVRIAGLDRVSVKDWSTTWVKAGISCANPGGGDRPASATDGTLPTTAQDAFTPSTTTYLQYPPASGDPWNTLANYETNSGCNPSSAGTTGQWQLTLTEDATHSVTLNVFSVSAGGAATQLAFLAQPTDVSNSSSLSTVTVEIRDASGFRATGSSTPVTIALGNNPSGATLGGTLTVNAVNGVATFGNLTLDKPGTGYTLTASSSGLTGTTSNAFNVSYSWTITAATLNGASSVGVLPGASIPAAVSATAAVVPAGGTWKGTTWFIGTTTPSFAGMACIDTPDHNAAGPFTNTFNITAPATPGTYNVYFATDDLSACTGNQTSALFTLAGSVTVVSNIAWTGAVSTDWNTAGNWNTNVVPTASDDITIPAGLTNYPVVSAAATAKSITMAGGSGAQPSLTVSSNTLTVAGNLTVNAGTVAQTGGTIAVTAGLVSITGTLNQSGGTILSSVDLTVNSGGSVNVSGSGVLHMASAIGTAATDNITVAGGATFTQSGGTVDVLALTLSSAVPLASYTQSGGTLTALGAVSVNGAMAVSAGTSLVSNTLTVNSAGNVNISGTGVLHMALTLPTSPTDAIVIAAGGAMTQSGGTVDVKDFTTTAGSPNGTYNQSGGTFHLYHDFRSSGIFNGTAGTVQFSGAGGGATWPTTTGPTQFFNVLIDTADPGIDGNAAVSFSVGGNWTANVAVGLTGKATTVTFNGGAAQTIGGTSATTFRNLTINNSSGNVSLNQDVTVGLAGASTGTLTFTQGNIVTGASRNVIIAAGGSVARTSGHVDGNLRKQISVNGSVARTFEVGTGGDYTPIDIALSTVASSATDGSTYLTARSTSGEHPSIAGSGFNPARDVNRYWTVTKTGPWTFTSYSGTFTFVPGDVDGGATTANFVVRKFDSPSTWTSTTTGTRTSTSTQGNGMTSFSDFAVGEAGAATQLAFVAQPTDVLNSTSLPTVTVEIRDASGFRVSGSTAPVTIALGNNPSSATLGGTLTMNAVDGLATFGDLTLDKTGTGYTLTAASTGFSTVTSNAFNVTSSWTITSATLNGAASVGVLPGSSVSAAVTATSPAATLAWNGTRYFIGTTPPSFGSMTCFNTGDHAAAAATFTETFSITAPASPGVYNVYFATADANTCTNQTSSLFTLAGSLTVVSNVAWTGAVSTDWNTAGNWNTNAVPTSTDDVTIPAGLTNYPVVAAAASAHSVLLASGGGAQPSLTISSNTLTVAANLTVAAGTVTQTGGTANLKGLVVNAGLPAPAYNESGGTLTVTDPVSLNGTLAVSGGTALLPNTLTVNSGANVNVSGTGVLHMAGALVTLPTDAIVIAVGGTITQSGGSVDVKDFTTTAGSPNGTYNQSGGAFKLYHDFRSSGTFNGTGGTVEFAAAGGGATWPSTLGPTQFFNVQNDVDPGFDTNAGVSIGVAGNWTANSTIMMNGKPTTVTFNGAGAQTIGGTGVTTFGNAVVNKSGGSLTLGANETVALALTLTSGNITTGANTLTSGNNATTGTVSASATGYVVGNLAKFVGNTSDPKTFEVGTGTFYTPITVDPVGNIAGTSGTSQLSATATAGDHPGVSTSGVNSSRDVNTYWTVTPVGDVSWTIPSTGYVVTTTFPAGDLDPGANTANFIVKRFLSSVWSTTTAGTRTSTSTQATVTFGANTGASSAFGDFATGEATGGASGTVVLSSTNPSIYGNSVTFTATVTAPPGGTAVTEGTVTFRDGGGDCTTGTVVQAATAVNGSGQVTYTTSTLTAGSHPIRACYSDSPSVNFAASNGTVTQTVNQRALTVSATAANRGYDGTTAAAVTLSDDRVSGDVFTVSFTGATFADKNVGTGKTVTVSGISISGPAAGNYTVNATASTTANIAARAITVTAATSTKQYDQTTSSTGTPTVTSGTLASGEVGTFTQTFDTKHAGTGKTLTPAGSVNDGNGGNNYAITFTAVTTGTITPKPLVVSAAGVNKVYDGLTTATVTLSDNRLSGDVFTDSYTSASFSNKNVGTAKPVSVSGISLSGTEAGDYTPNTTASASADITPKPLTVSAAGVNREYDGTTAATVTLTDDRVSGDVFTTSYTSASFANKNVGTAKPVSVSGISLSGADAGNYSFNTTAAATANISARAITVTAATDSRLYNGTAASTGTPTITSGSLASGDVGSFTQTFNNKNVGTGKTLTPAGSVSDGNSGNNYAVTFTAVNTGTITAKPLAVSATGVNREYDGTTTATVNLSDDRVSGDVFTTSYTSASFADKNAGTAKPVSVTGISISGTDAGNYTFNTTAATTANISARAITVTAATDSKQYDQSASSTGTPTVTSGTLVSGEVGSFTQTFDTKHAGTGKTLTPAGSVADGNSGHNYAITFTAVTTGTITPKPLVVTATGVNRQYDGTTAATVTLSDNRLSGDVFTDSYTSASFADKHVGTAKPVSVSGISLSGTEAGDYTPNTTASASADITPRALTVTATGVNREYDGTTAATVTLSDDRVSGDVFTTSYASASFANKNVGTAKPVSVSGISLSGADAGNYSFNATASTTASISARAITVTAVTDSRQYNGTTASAGIPTVTTGSLASGDSPSFTQTFDTKNVGTGKTLTPAGAVTDGNYGHNYAVTFVAVNTGSISAKPLVVSATGVNREYDGTTTATVTLSDDRVTGDVFTTSYTSASFADRNAGTAKPVSVTGISISGTDAGNYTFNTTAATTANITPRPITVTAVTDSKEYDQSASSTGTPTVTSGTLVSGDVGHFTQSFDTKHAGTGKTLTPAGSVTDGNYSHNYAITFTAVTTGTITPRPLVVSATGVNRVYDGTTTATVTLSDNRLSGDAFTDSYTSASFGDKNVGTGKAISVAGISLSGTEAGDYTPNTTASASANITARPLVVSATGVNREYDGTTAATVTLSDDRVSGDVFTTSYTTAAFTNKNAGTDKTVNVSGISISGTDAGNYSFNATASTTANISTRPITVTAATDSKQYNGTTASAGTPTVTTGSLASGDTPSFTQTFDTKNVGTGKTLTPAGSVSDGNSGNNYTVTFTPVSTGTISARPLVVSATGINREYDGTTAATVTLSDDRVSGDVFTDSYTSASFADRNAGTAKPVSVSGISISGTDAGNYTFNTTAATTANITPRPITVTAATDSKEYDQNTSSTGTPTVTSGALVSGDVGHFTQTFDTKHAGTGKTLTPAGSVTDGNYSHNYAITFTAVTTGTITPKQLVVSATGVNRVYDGTTTATVTLSDNRLTGDVFTDNYTGASFGDKNVGTGKPVSVSGISLSGTDAGNYTPNTTAATSANITARPLVVSASGTNREYDGTTAATVTLSDDRVSGDVFTDSYTGASFADKHVGTAKAVTVSGISISGTDAGNYSFNATALTTANISARPITVTAVTDSRQYNGTAASTGTPAIGPGTLAGGDVAAFTQAFDTKNVGTGKTLTPTGAVTDGNSGHDYGVTFVPVSTGSISAKPLLVSATGVNREYDGTTTATVTLSDDRIGGDVFTDSYTSASFADRNAGTGKAVSVSGISISGTDAGNYTANTTAATTANISARPITVTAATDSKPYDQNTSSTGTPTLTLGTLVSGDVGHFTQTFDTRNAGTGKTLTPAGSVTDGNYGHNYAITFTPVTTGTITPKPLVVSATGVNRVYDGTTTATVTLSDNRITGDVFTDNYTGASFGDKNVGTGKPASVSGISLSGTDAGNYTPNTTASTSANITARPLVVSATGVSKGYDGTTTATVTLSDDRVSGDVFTDSYTGAAFVDKHVGTGKTVNVSGIGISGTDAGNYSFNATCVTTADISPRAITVTAVTDGRPYNGSTASAGTPAIGPGTLAVGDVAAFTQAFDTKNVGTGKTLTPAGAVTNGNSGHDYAVTFVPVSTGSISARPLVVSATGVNKVFDGTTAATVTLSDNRVSGDVFADGYTGASFADANVGTAKAVSVTGISISGTDAGNYSANTTAATTANISTAPVTAKAGGGTAIFDATTKTPSACAVTGTYIGDLSCTNSPTSVGPNAGTFPITPVTSGTGLSNFAITPVNGSYTIVDQSAPIVSNTLALPVAINTSTGQVTSTVSDVTTGNSNIVSAYFTVDGGAPIAMTATDGGFNSPTENVQGTIPGYNAADVKTLCVYGTDAAGKTGSDCILLAIYDPSAGFVTGGGWITSPAGAYTANPSLTGKANFGFVSKYTNGRTIPTGNTEFQFQTASFNFSSTVYEWLVVSGAMAQYKGSGTINGSGDYGFLLTAVDGQLTGGGGTDKFRIKVWNKTTGAVIYDNNIGASDTATPTTLLGGGSIVIHK